MPPKQERPRRGLSGGESAGVVGFQASRPHEDNPARAGVQFPVRIASIQKGDSEVRVSLDEFKGNLTIDVRLFESFTAAKMMMPTKRGVTLGIARLPELAAALAEAETQARQLGLIGGAE